jgi:hypothetical protein
MQKLESDSGPLLRRKELATRLSQDGYPTSEQTLAHKAVDGSGPPFVKWGRYPLYRWSTSIRWAQERAGRPRTSTSAERAA